MHSSILPSGNLMTCSFMFYLANDLQKSQFHPFPFNAIVMGEITRKKRCAPVRHLESHVFLNLTQMFSRARQQHRPRDGKWRPVLGQRCWIEWLLCYDIIQWCCLAKGKTCVTESFAQLDFFRIRIIPRWKGLLVLHVFPAELWAFSSDPLLTVKLWLRIPPSATGS